VARIKRVAVSDHAVLRYLERRYKTDVEAIRQEILTPCRVAAIKAGASQITVAGLTFKISDGVITTILKRNVR